MITYTDACRVINDSRDESVVVTTMTQTKYWYQISKHPDLDIGIANAMSKASSVALGVALGKPERSVICLDADGSLLMNFGSLATIAGMAPENLYHFVFNNGIYSVTGGQAVPAPGVEYAKAAEACGYASVYRFDDVESLDSSLSEILSSPGPVLIEIMVKGQPQAEGIDQTWESNAKMPLQLRTLRKRLTGADDWGPGGPYL
ncbi:MAG: thiamine pyrophosphate-binding protein [Chloroflexi bacterium]|jgi:phosphonopyruvate decarboxylase|nr:thiamine pyrophosphate-binding protein [Chloroflexota bacterium]MBT3862398.1 thiamine pyrophosphate-binding protein [Chloroflexota bacterium]MBT4943330.1 thiamine pyrophosphate-binding protein [Chloroflexota bacterium]MBT6707963.1 thiamine pyrophosphate-binding protein [Chloroflexota bacterium]MBT7003266.1 thiamine pyrophosphate-binding protein [Chloroflexota bacterium]